MKDHWTEYQAKWDRVKPPLRPTPQVVAAMKLSLEDFNPVLLLGVTAELAKVAEDVTAVDRSAEMIDTLWPKDATPAVLGDWLKLPIGSEKFGGVVGDGCFCVVPYQEHERLLAEVARVLKPHGRAIFRLFCRPYEFETVAHVFETVEQTGFHAFKWRLAMALTESLGGKNIPVQSIYEAFVAGFPDREQLAVRTGWDLRDIATIDVYNGSTEVYSFPTRQETFEAVPTEFATVRFVEMDRYELSDRCPLLILDREG